MISRIIRSLIANGIAFALASYFLPGFVLSGDIISIAALVLVFTAINAFVYPIIKLVLSPLIFFTLGLFAIVIHAGILYIIDIYSTNISISGPITLLYATLIITAVNILFGVGSKLAK